MDTETQELQSAKDAVIRDYQAFRSASARLEGLTTALDRLLATEPRPSWDEVRSAIAASLGTEAANLVTNSLGNPALLDEIESIIKESGEKGDAIDELRTFVALFSARCHQAAAVDKYGPNFVPRHEVFHAVDDDGDLSAVSIKFDGVHGEAEAVLAPEEAAQLTRRLHHLLMSFTEESSDQDGSNKGLADSAASTRGPGSDGESEVPIGFTAR